MFLENMAVRAVIEIDWKAERKGNSPARGVGDHLEGERLNLSFKRPAEIDWMVQGHSR